MPSIDLKQNARKEDVSTCAGITIQLYCNEKMCCPVCVQCDLSLREEQKIMKQKTVCCAELQRTERDECMQEQREREKEKKKERVIRCKQM